MRKAPDVTSDKPITESFLYKKSLEISLIGHFCNEDTRLDVPLDEEIDKEFPKDPAYGDDTRLLVTRIGENNEQVMMIARENDRLNVKIDIDTFLNFCTANSSVHYTTESSIEDIQNVTHSVLSTLLVDVFGGYDTGENEGFVDNTITRALGALIAICLNDPLEAHFILYQKEDETTHEMMQYCYLSAVKPRRRN